MRIVSKVDGLAVLDAVVQLQGHEDYQYDVACGKRSSSLFLVRRLMDKLSQFSTRNKIVEGFGWTLLSLSSQASPAAVAGELLVHQG